jgi:hypothetical protein
MSEIPPKIEDWGVTVEEYLEGMAQGIDILEIRSLEARGIPTHLAIEVFHTHRKIINKTATPEEVVRGLMILSPNLIQKVIEMDQQKEN